VPKGVSLMRGRCPSGYLNLIVPDDPRYRVGQSLRTTCGTGAGDGLNKCFQAARTYCF
jgi:hypothetical protein